MGVGRAPREVWDLVYGPIRHTQAKDMISTTGESRSEEGTNDLASTAYKVKRTLLKRKYNNRFRRMSSSPDSTPTADSDAGNGGQGVLSTGPTPVRGCYKHRHTGERPGLWALRSDMHPCCR